MTGTTGDQGSQRTRVARRGMRARLKVVSEKSAGAVVFTRSARIEYLLIYSRFWEFPKGHVDKNESEMDTSRREVKEETGLDVEFVPDFRADINYLFRRKNWLVRKRVVFLLAEAHTREVKLSAEHGEYIWLPFDAALTTLTYENSREILRQANEFLERHEDSRR